MTFTLKAVRPSLHFMTAQARPSLKCGAIRKQFELHGRRCQGTIAPDAHSQNWLHKMWNSPIGIKTVHFWAPVMKWSIVLAGVSDFYRPAEKLSITQNLALTSTGLIWTRWCFVIKPKNMLLATVNFFLGVVGIIQVSRIVAYNYGEKHQSAEKVTSSA